VFVQPSLADAIEEAVMRTEEDDEEGVVSGGGVIVTGSVVTAGEARALFGKEPS
jgi:dihydrofolate synthase / folylpolyglutamate synthase